MPDINETVLPGDETLNIDVQLIPDWHDGLIVLLVPLDDTGTKLRLYSQQQGALYLSQDMHINFMFSLTQS